MKNNEYDCSGWATRANLLCGDGRVIMKDAFKDCDGMVVPLVWNHQHNDPENVLGHALLENRDGDIYTYCKFNNTESGNIAKELVNHGDVTQFSIYANRVKQEGKKVIHGVIREVSIVLAGANPGAVIEDVVNHGEEEGESFILSVGDDNADVSFSHAEDDDEKKKKGAESDSDSDKKEEPKTEEEPKKDEKPDEKEEPKAEEEKKAEEKTEDNETPADIFNSMNEKQQMVTMALINSVMESNKTEEDKSVKHNIFDEETKEENVLSHSDGVEIVKMAKSYGGGSLKAAMESYAEQNNKDIKHTDLGFANISTLFPEYKDVRPGAPEMLTTDQGWISKVLNKVHKSPISRIRTRQADIRDITNLRARGYSKQTQKADRGNIALLSRTTDPVTVYVRSKLDRDDIIDITDFDVVQYMYNVDRMNLNEELATAIMIGDGRVDGTTGKIDETKIRPVWTDDELYTIHVEVDVDAMRTEMNGTNSSANFGENYVYAEAIIQSLLYGREHMKGTGSPDFFCTPHLLNVMLLARDLNGRRIYDNVNELKAALNVNEIVTAEQFANRTRTKTEKVNNVDVTKTMRLLGILYNLSDYSLGATKGGEITHFTDFDINFNQEVSLLETRVSGANTRPLSAIVLEEVVSSEDDGE